MKSFLFTVLSLAISMLSTVSHGAAILGVTWDSGSYTLVNNNGVTPITGGTGNHNGAVLQLGYFSSSTSGSLFSGSWVPLSGEGSLNTTFANTTIGDFPSNGASSGSFAFSIGQGSTPYIYNVVTNPNPGTTFTIGDAGTGNSLPVAGVLLAVRFYNNTTIASSTFFETVANASWVWVTPNSPPPSPVAITFDDPSTKLQSTGNAASGSTIRTAIATAAPEPTSAALMMVGLVSLVARRRRQAK